MDWKSELLKRLDVLADKLGTTAVQLWAVLTKQAYLTGVMDLVFAAVFLVIAAIVLPICIKGFRQAIADDWDNGFYIGKAWGGLLLLILLFGCAFSNIYTGVREVINPQYYALQDILQQIVK